MTIDNYLIVFEKELRRIDKRFAIIGGSFALLLHGIEINWQPSDLDIIIHSEPGKENYKVHRDDYCLNIVYSDGPMAPFYLTYKGWAVNSVKNVVKSKLIPGVPNCRVKDALHLQTLKNLNFNIEV